MLDEGGDVGSEEVLAFAESDHQRRVAACADDEAGVVLVGGEEGEGSLETVDDGAERGLQVTALGVLAAEQGRGDLGVGLAEELDAVRARARRAAGRSSR